MKQLKALTTKAALLLLSGKTIYKDSDEWDTILSEWLNDLSEEETTIMTHMGMEIENGIMATVLTLTELLEQGVEDAMPSIESVYQGMKQ